MSEFESFFDQTSDAMCVLTPSGEVLRSNLAFQQLIQSTPRGALSDLHDEEGARTLAAALRSLQDEDVADPPPTFATHAQRWIDWRFTKMESGEVIALGRDITRQHESTVALTEKSAFLHSIIEAEPECVKLVSRDGRLLDMNPAGLQMIGAPDRESVLGAEVSDLIAEEDRDRFREFHAQVCNGTGGQLDFELVALDGKRRSMQTTAVPLQRGTSDELLHLAITRDVTDRVMLEQQLNESQRMEAVGQLAGGIAHDFNNLLTAIISPAEMALADLDPDSEIAQDLRQIKETGERAARMTQRLLAFARKEVSRLEPMSITDMAESSHEMLERMVGSAYSLKLACDQDVPAVRADRSQLEQVLMNLVVNARDALDGGGDIQVSVTREDVEPTRAALLGCQPGSYVALRVRDEGAGVPAALAQKIFEPFFTTKAAGAGTGLGLPTCQRILTNMGGAMDLETAEGVGSTFSALLPVAYEAAAAEQPSSVAPGAGQKILVVDDEAVVRGSVSRMLRSLGYEPIAVEGGHAAIQRAQQDPTIQLVVTDMTMPRMSGVELADSLRGVRPGLEVLFMTGYLEQAIQSAGERSFQAHEVLQKPFTKQALAAAVGRSLAHAALPTGVQAS